MKNLILVLLIFSAVANGQSKIPYLEINQSANKLTGVLTQDLLPALPRTISHEDSFTVRETRSSLKAGVLSLLIPGAGQFYNGGTLNYLKAAGFFAIEVGAIASNIIWINKGNNQTNFFENYADGTAADNYANGHYNILRYVQWIQQNYMQFEKNGIPVGGGQITSVNDPSTVNYYIGKIIDNNGGPAPWDKVNWNYLAKVENALGGYFSHNLEGHGTEQYYELIGKYPQFRVGWYDENLSFTNYDQLNTPTPNSGYYMGQRGLANNLYGVAGTAIGIVIANHFASAIEAAIWAHGHNKLIETSLEISPLPLQGVSYQTQLNLAVNF